MKENIIQTKSFDFALLIIDLYQKLKDEHEYVISKMSIASKEARETNYWIRLLNKSDITSLNLIDHEDKSEEIVRILTSIVKTTRSNS